MAMKQIGPEQRAKQLRSAANRLRWEIDIAIEDARENPRLTHLVSAAIFDWAEAVAILSAVGKTLDEFFPEGHPERQKFAQVLDFYREYHRTAR